LARKARPSHSVPHRGVSDRLYPQFRLPASVDHSIPKAVI